MSDSYQILKYLDRNYYVRNHTFFQRPAIQVWGKTIVYELEIIFHYNYDFCESYLSDWARRAGFPEDEELWLRGYCQQRLNTRFDPNLNKDFRTYLGQDCEAMSLEYLYNCISSEIESTFLKSFIASASTMSDFLEVMRCEGYVLGPVIFESGNSSPLRSFVTTSYDELVHERKTNKHWQRWARGSDSNLP